MDNDQLTALAREYAEEMIKGKPSEELPNCLKNSMLAMNTEYVAGIFRWLMRRYCLVEKGKVVAEYKNVAKAVKAKREYNLTLSEDKLAKADLLFDLFPEIAKEVEDGLV